MQTKPVEDADKKQIKATEVRIKKQIPGTDQKSITTLL